MLTNGKNATAVAGIWIALLLLWSGNLRADEPSPGNDLAVTPMNQAVTISVLTNDMDPSNQLGVLQVTAPAHGTVVINSNAAVLTTELSNLFQFSAIQLSNSVKQVGSTNNYPRSTLTNGTWMLSPVSDWIVGFFPGAMWYVYEQTGDTNFLKWAQQWTAGIASQQHVTNTDDIGFMINTSFGNGLRITGSTNYRSVVITGAQSFTNRYNAIVRSLADDTLLAPTNFQVIMDTMMNLELLYHGADLNGNTNISLKAFNHQQRAMTNQVRADGSTYQEVLYSTVNGDLTFQGTRAGYSDTSCWSRGQAWGIYGFTMGYRETGYLPFLNAAQQCADFYISNVPSDHVPYWDFFDPAIPNSPRDSSAAAITMSALIQLAELTTNLANASNDWAEAHNILESLGSTNYLAKGTTNSSILLHGVGNTPVLPDPEVNVGLIYGDYYFVESLRRFALAYGRNTVTYTPNPGFTGTDTFNYQVCDSAGQTAIATVTVVVQPSSNPPPFTATATVNATNEMPTISFPTTSGFLYDVQFKDDLSMPGSWSTLASNVVGSNAVSSVTDQNPAAIRYYRVGAH